MLLLSTFNVISDFGDITFSLTLPRPSVVTWTVLFTSARLSPSSYFKFDGRLMKVNSTRIDRTPQIFFARRTAHVVSYEDEEAWDNESGFNILHAARAFHLSDARHRVTHSQA